ncbi:MAG: hypothetical protein WKF53_12395 [Rubrobacter sp.]
MDITKGEAVEGELDLMIARRARDNPERDLEAMYAASVRRFKARQRDHIRWEWVRHFDRMADSHRRLSEDYERRAEALMETDGRITA